MKGEIDFRQGYDYCIQHIDLLTHDADLLAENHSFCHAAFLYFTAMEEAVKAWYYAGIHMKLFQYKRVRRGLMEHLYKTNFFAMALLGQAMWERRYVPSRTPTRHEYEGLKEGLKEYIDAIPEFRSSREACLYVDLEDNRWKIPLDVGEEDFRKMRNLVTNFIRWVKSVTLELFEMPREEYDRTVIVKILSLWRVWKTSTKASYPQENPNGKRHDTE